MGSAHPFQPHQFPSKSPQERLALLERNPGRSLGSPAALGWSAVAGRSLSQESGSSQSESFQSAQANELCPLAANSRSSFVSAHLHLRDLVRSQFTLKLQSRVGEEP